MSTSKRWLIFAGVLVLLAASGGIFGPSAWENWQAGRIKAKLEAMKPPVRVEKVAVSLANKSIVLTKAKTSLPQAGEAAELTVESVTIAGADISGLVSYRFSTDPLHADQAIATGISVSFTRHGVRQTLDIREATAKNIFCDPRALKKTEDGARRPALAFLHSVSADLLRADDLVLRTNGGIAAIKVQAKSFESAGIKQLSTGKSAFNELTVSGLSGDMITLKTFGLNSLALADPFRLADSLELVGSDEGEKAAATMVDEHALVIDGLVMQNLAVRIPLFEPLNLRQARLSLRAAKGNSTVTLAVEGLDFPLSLLARLEPVLKPITKVYKKNLLLSGNVEAQVNLTGQFPVFTVSEMRLVEESLGGAGLSFVVREETPYKGNGLLAYLKETRNEKRSTLLRGTVFAEDRGFLTLVFEVMALTKNVRKSEKTSAEAVRAKVVEDLRQAAATSSQEDKEILEAVVRWVADSGRIVASIEADPNTPPKSGPGPFIPEGAKRSVTYTPPAK